MGLPDVSLTIRDGALGLAQPNGNNICLKIGPSPKGVVNSIVSASDPTTLTAALGKGGPLAEAAALSLLYGGAPVYCVPVNPSTYGTVGSVTSVKTGSGTLAVTAKPSFGILGKITLGGALGTARIAFSFDGGTTYGPDMLTAATIMVPGASFVTIAMSGATGGSWVIGDLWTIGTGSTAPALTGTGTGTLTLSSASPVDNYSVVVNITGAGNLGVGTFQYSLDGGQSFSGTLLLPSGGYYTIPDAGVLLQFGGTAFVVGDQYTFSATAPVFTGTDVTNAITAALADSRTWFLCHIVGAAATVSAAATLLATLDGLLSTAQAAYRFAAGAIEVPADSDANILSAFASASSKTVMACASSALTVSPITGRIHARSSAWHITARAAQVVPSEDLGWVGRGALKNIPSASIVTGVTPLTRDEQATPGLDAARFATLRTIIGVQGYYIANPNLMAPVGSDFKLLQYRRVMDIACTTARQALLPYLNDSVRTKADGTIDERDAKNIEAATDSALRNALTRPGYASDVSAAVSRSEVMTSTNTLRETVRVQTLAYNKIIAVDIGFLNPALAAK